MERFGSLFILKEKSNIIFHKSAICFDRVIAIGWRYKITLASKRSQSMCRRATYWFNRSVRIRGAKVFPLSLLHWVVGTKDNPLLSKETWAGLNILLDKLKTLSPVGSGTVSTVSSVSDGRFFLPRRVRHLVDARAGGLLRPSVCPVSR
jgi:hypothetical protein